MKTEKVVVSMTPETVKINVDEIPKYQMDTLCHVILKSTEKAFKDPQFAADYEKWLVERHKSNKEEDVKLLKTTISC